MNRFRRGKHLRLSLQIESCVDHPQSLDLDDKILAVFLMILGLQFVMTGLLAEIISRIYFTTHEMRIYSIREIQSHPDTGAESGV